MALRLLNGADGTLAIYLIGDGTDTEVVVDLAEPPINMDLKANKPSAVGPVTTSANYAGTVTGTIQGTKLTLTLSDPIPTDDAVAIYPRLYFNAAG